MPLYLGSNDKHEIRMVFNGITWILDGISATYVTNNVRLLSSENYILKDSDGLYLMVKEDR